jgi:hypothetical protein
MGTLPKDPEAIYWANSIFVEFFALSFSADKPYKRPTMESLKPAKQRSSYGLHPTIAQRESQWDYLDNDIVLRGITGLPSNGVHMRTHGTEVGFTAIDTAPATPCRGEEENKRIGRVIGCLREGNERSLFVFVEEKFPKPLSTLSKGAILSCLKQSMMSNL